MRCRVRFARRRCGRQSTIRAFRPRQVPLRRRGQQIHDRRCTAVRHTRPFRLIPRTMDHPGNTSYQRRRFRTRRSGSAPHWGRVQVLGQLPLDSLVGPTCARLSFRSRQISSLGRHYRFEIECRRVPLRPCSECSCRSSPNCDTRIAGCLHRNESKGTIPTCGSAADYLL